MNKTVVGIVVVLAVLVAGYFFFADERVDVSENETADITDGLDDSEQTENDGTVGDMARAEDNAVVAVDQKPGNSVTVAQVFLAAPGFAVFHADNGGAPGEILGASTALSAGQSDRIEVMLSRATQDGETLHSMLHNDVDGNAAFDASVDTPVESRLGGPISGWFTISADASENIGVTL